MKSPEQIMHVWSTDFWQGGRGNSAERVVFSNKGKKSSWDGQDLLDRTLKTRTTKEKIDEIKTLPLQKKTRKQGWGENHIFDNLHPQYIKNISVSRREWGGSKKTGKRF